MWWGRSAILFLFFIHKLLYTFSNEILKNLYLLLEKNLTGVFIAIVMYLYIVNSMYLKFFNNETFFKLHFLNFNLNNSQQILSNMVEIEYIYYQFGIKILSFCCRAAGY